MGMRSLWKEMKRKKGGTANLSIEPTKGCANLCRQCSLSTDTNVLSHLRPNVLNRRIGKIKDIGVKFGFAQYTGRGDPISNPELHELTDVLRKHFPNMYVASFWGLTYVGKDELVKRTRGLNLLCVSVDDHHFAGVMKQMAKSGELPKENRKEAVLEKMREMIRAAYRAANRNRFDLQFRFTGIPSETERWEAFVRSVLPSESIVPVYYSLHYFRDKRGTTMVLSPYQIAVYHDGRIGMPGQIMRSSGL
ncbi:Uncharacterised protein [Candidatus Norongarragalina meridionalis]|nr:Uncharacterised protein [Candidatus Norongarragalina meridionalis]